MNKRIMILGIVVTLIVAFVGATMLANPPILAKKASGSIIWLNTEFPELNESYPAYDVITPNVTVDYVISVGKTFELNGTPRESFDWFILVDESKGPFEEIEIDKSSGAVRYEIPAKRNPVIVNSQPNLPSDEEARRIAREYLLNKKMLPKNKHVRYDITRVMVDYSVESYRAGIEHPIESYDVTKAVVFSPHIDDFPVYGGTISVVIGDNGEVVGVYDRSREIVPSGNVKIKPPEKAYEELIAGKGMIPPILMGTWATVIDSVSIGYRMELPIDQQTSMQPVYVFKGTAKGISRDAPYIQFVSAVENISSVN